MTTELTDTELRVKCAEAMGWKHRSDIKYADDLEHSMYNPASGRSDLTLPNYPADPAAALTLVDKLGEEGWSVEINKQIDVLLWVVVLDLDAPKFSSRTVRASGDTFCRAICRAFLAVKGKE